MKRLALAAVLVSLALASLVFGYTGANKLVWNANTEADLAGYKVYIGTAPGVYTITRDVGKTATPAAPSVTLGSLALADGPIYYYAVTAYDTSGLESLTKSNEVSGPLDNQPPAAVTGVKIQ